MVAKASSYEESRRKRMEENQKRMEALSLTKLSQSLHKSSSPISKPSPSKPRTPIKKELVVVRRSGRVANMPAPVYKEILIDSVKIPRNRISRDYSKRVYASDEARMEAMEKADKLLSDLDSDHPTFVKSMLQSHVTGGFWLGLPNHFCRKNLPKRDEVMTLIDEDGDESPTTYLAHKTGLSAGWRGFAIAHNLVDGDALIFELVKRTAFKVYIIRVNEGKQDD
ncbi:B3 domain-containing protein At3g19184 isoform X2 [Medicago truncatula]|uniref:B3 domain transcription factor n=1 Tax=Medicago truncatula TaxID=3880 RepID=A0A072V1N6_MEDTR|nr:B3 domain-containing protein At3g19184 isoform X2 [Medicago truncatula]KEH35747.1 B3 domain transcription factor [Medicago truncatula]